MRGIAYSPVVLHLQLSQGLILVELSIAALYFQAPLVYNHVDILFLNLLLNTETMYKDVYTKLCHNLQEGILTERNQEKQREGKPYCC